MAFNVVIKEAELLHRELVERNVDLLITRRFGDLANERLDFQALFTDPYVVVAGAQNPLVRRRRLELAELVDGPWTLSPPENALGVVAKGVNLKQKAYLAPAATFQRLAAMSAFGPKRTWRG